MNLWRWGWWWVHWVLAVGTTGMFVALYGRQMLAIGVMVYVA